MAKESRHGGFRTGAVAVVAALGGLLAFSEYSRFRTVADLETVKTDAAAALAAVIEPQTVRSVEDSVYLVQTPRAYATAFVIDREKGLLATAAHVVEDLDVLDPGKANTVVNRFSGKPLRIVAARAHSGYGALTRIAEDYQPIDPEGRLFPPAVVPIYDSAFDAAILIVDPIDPETGENILGPSLAIASREKLLALQTGDPIAVVSYPKDALGTDESVASRAERGIVSAMLAPIDYAEASDDPLYRTVIAHRMTTKSGSSGAPLIDGDGEVVGVFVASGGSDSFACRADLFYDLLSPLGEEKSLAEIHALEWRRRLSRWTRAKDALPYLFYRGLGLEPRPQRDAVLGVRDYGAQPYSATVADLKFGEALGSFAVAAPDLLPETEEAAAEGEARPVPTFTLPEEAQFAVRKVTLRARRVSVVFAFDYSLASPSGYCPVGLYHRRLGAGPFTEIGASLLPFAVLPAGSYELVYYRPLDDGEPCDGRSDRFMAGIVSWPQEEESAAKAIALNHPGGVSGLLESARVSALNFVHCKFARDEACVAPVYVSFENGEP